MTKQEVEVQPGIPWWVFVGTGVMALLLIILMWRYIMPLIIFIGLIPVAGFLFGGLSFWVRRL